MIQEFLREVYKSTNTIHIDDNIMSEMTIEDAVIFCDISGNNKVHISSNNTDNFIRYIIDYNFCPSWWNPTDFIKKAKETIECILDYNLVYLFNKPNFAAMYEIAYPPCEIPETVENLESIEEWVIASANGKTINDYPDSPIMAKFLLYYNSNNIWNSNLFIDTIFSKQEINDAIRVMHKYRLMTSDIFTDVLECFYYELDCEVDKKIFAVNPKSARNV